MAYHRSHGVEVRIVRIFNTYGPSMRIDDGRAFAPLPCRRCGGAAHRARGRDPDALAVLRGRPDRGDLAAARERPGGAGQPGEPGGGDDPRAGPDGGAGGRGRAEDRAAAPAGGRPGAAARHHQGGDRAGVEAAGQPGGGGPADGALVPAGPGRVRPRDPTRAAAAATPGGARPGAFFDVDKTLLPGSSMYLFARGCTGTGSTTCGTSPGSRSGSWCSGSPGPRAARGWRRPASRRSPSSRASAATT